MDFKINFFDEDWARIERDWSLWWQGELDRPMAMIQSLNLSFTQFPEEFTNEFMLNKPVDELLDYFGKRYEITRFFGDSWPKWFPNFGPGIAAGFLGANVVGSPDVRTVWFNADKPLPLDALRFQYDPDNVWWKRIVTLTRAAVERWGDRVAVAHTDLGGNLDILASFRTAEKLLCDCIDAPEEVVRCMSEITAVWLRYYNELLEIMKPAGRGTSNWAEIWSPQKTYMLQSDFSYMISPKMFEKFVLPDLEACCENMDHAFYHLDGKGEIAHLDMLLSIKKLAGIQWIPGAGEAQADEWLPLLKRIRDAGKLVQVYVTQDAARKIAKELGGKGFAFYIVRWPPMSDEQTEDYIKMMAVGKY